MAMHIYDLGWMLAQVLLLLCSAPLVAGIIKKVKSLLQNRIGSSIFQEYFDLYKWWQKPTILTPYTSLDVYKRQVNPSAINTRIGVEIETGEMISILQKLQFEVHEEGEDLIVTAPSWRYDVTCDADISEEVARMHSYDKIASHMPALPLVQGRQDVIEDVRDSVEDYLASVGLSEVMTYSFIHPCSFDKLELPADDERRR